MIILVDLDSQTPLYQQIRDRIIEGVADGRLRAGDPLPSTRQLGSDLGINFHTVNKGYDALRTEGMLRLNRKSGAVICRDQASGPPTAAYIEDWEARARTLLAEAVAQGMAPGEVVERCGRLVAAFAPGHRTEPGHRQEGSP